ncbi:MAG: hypothetical protein JWM59_822 [Verrucomicrobiales bacterium]|nr:hypothetical protein [Verrucomicrobiales bacterium]
MRSISLLAPALLTVILPSCEVFQGKQADTYGAQPSANPYGEVPQSNPYATPPVSPYTQAPPAPSNPYSQGVPSPSNPYGGYEQPQTYPAPSTGSSPATAPPSSAYTSGSGGGQVVVQPGDNLTKIAKRNNTTVPALKAANNLTSDMIRAGQKLTLP